MDGGRRRSGASQVGRRRRIVAVLLACAALASFGLGCRLARSGRDAAPRLTATLPLTQLAGERVVVGLDGSGLTPGLRRAIEEGRIAGVVLFASNFPSRDAGRRLIARLEAVPRPPKPRAPLLVMTDQEGGQVRRVDGEPVDSAQAIGAHGAAYAHAQGAATGRSLAALGVNVDLAPVLDVGRPGGFIAATERAFGADAATVGRAGIAFGLGLQSAGVAATAKHFPGLGAATESTDFEPEEIDLPATRLQAIDEAPYKAFAAAGGKLVMISTATYPALGRRPAAFERAIATDELRRRIGFSGVSITDSLGGGAVAAFGGQREAAVAAAAAGTDLLLFDDLPSALAGERALEVQLRKGKLGRARFEASVERVLALRRALG